MTQDPTIFQRARRPINLLVGGIFVALTLVFGSVFLRDMLNRGLAQKQGQLGAQQPVLAQRQLDLSNIRAHIEQFGVLRRQGLVGIADREGWAEQLVASREQLALPASLSYTLKPQQAMTDPAQPETEPLDPDVANSGTATQHNLDFEITGITETELFAFLHDYKAKVHGLYRVQTCRLSNATPTGLAAQCTLRFFNLPDRAKTP